MKIYLFTLLAFGSLFFSACNESTKAKGTNAKSAELVSIPKAKRRLTANPGDTILAQPGDTVYMNNKKLPKDNYGLPNGFFNRNWMKSPTEDEKFKGEVFRPEGFRTLQPMRFRPTIKFNKDRTCKYLKLMPNDKHEMQDAAWAYNKNKQLRVFVKGDSGREMIYNWQVKEVKGNLLVVESSN